MGWVWNNDDDSNNYSSSGADIGEFRGSSNPNGEGGSVGTRRVVKSQCRTEEVEPGKFIRKCEKTEQVFRDCVGRPTEMVQSNKEYTEEDVTDQMVKGSFSFKSAEQEPPFFPGVRSDIEAIEREFFGGMDKFFQAAEAMKNKFFKSVGAPHIYSDEDPSYRKPGIHIETDYPKETFTKKNSDGDVDLSGLARDV